MQQSSIGRQGQQNQGPNMNINIYDQTQRLRGHVGLSTPIQEGFQGGQATINDDTESDAGSLLYTSNNDFAGIQATPACQQPAQPENTGGHSLLSTSPVQSASGFSGVSMNIPSGGHLRPLQSHNEELVATDVDLQSLKRKLKRELGNKYEKDVANCVTTFNGTTLSEADVSKCSSQLLYYLGDNAVKCMICKHTGNIGTIFRHEERCIVGICSQRDQNMRGETSYKAPYIPGSHQTCSESSFFTGGYATAPGPPQNRTAPNVHLPPEIQGISTRFPFYQRHDRRLDTFHNWRFDVVQPKKYLADAGLFYLGIDDQCQCFDCGLVLREWKISDNPWSEHARLSQNCPFVMREKGREFVNEVMRNAAEEEIRTPPTIFRTNTGRSEANPQRSYQAMIAEDNSLDCRLLDMGFTKEQIQVAINRFRKVNGSKEYTTEHLIEIIISDENQEGNLMSQSICGACSRREVGVSQFECGHIVCRKCAAPNVGDRCKICGKQVVKVVLFDAATLKK